jgi:hypothetical protein
MTLRYRFPRTLPGWLVLFRLTIGVCPFCKSWLNGNWPYDSNTYCLPCGGAILPNGFWEALHWNYNDHERAKRKGE